MMSINSQTQLDASKSVFIKPFHRLPMLIIFLGIMLPSPVMSSGEKWVKITSTKEGSQWWDTKSLKNTKSKNNQI